MVLESFVSWLQKEFTVESGGALVIGLILGYALGRFFSESFGEQARYDYLTAKKRLR